MAVVGEVEQAAQGHQLLGLIVDLRGVLLENVVAPARAACWSLNTVSGLNRCRSPSRRHWYSPPSSSLRWAAPRDGRVGHLVTCGDPAAIWSRMVNGYPPRCNSSRTSSKRAVSDGPGVQIGNERSIPGKQLARHRLARSHPVLVALHGVDFAVVGTNRYGSASGQDGKVFLKNRESPAGAPTRPVGRAGREELAQLGRCEHALVDDST